MKRTAWLGIGASLVLILLIEAGCYSVPVSGRSSLNLVSDSAVVEMSTEQFEQLKSELPISQDPKYNDLVQRVGQRIAEVSQWDILNPEWEFVVFDDDHQLNAFAMAGGKVGVFTGLFEVIKKDDDLAIVMGHEVAHVAAKHIHERISKQMITQGVAIGLSVAVSGQSSLGQSAILNAYGLGSALSGLSFNRKMEKEADYIGLMYAARAGYDPQAAIDLWTRLSEKDEGQSPPAFLSTHPSHGSRLAYLHEIMPEALTEYEATQKGAPREEIIIID